MITLCIPLSLLLRNSFMLCLTLDLESTFDGAVLIGGFDSAKFDVSLIEFNIAKKVLIGSDKVKHLLGAGPIVQNSNVKVSFNKGWMLTLDAYLNWKSISVYQYRRWILFSNALAAKIDKIAQGSLVNENNWLCVEVYQFWWVIVFFFVVN